MAKIVLGIGTSHTPMLALTSEQWAHRAAVDMANPKLNLSDGRRLTYPELLAEVGPRYQEVVTADVLGGKEAICEAALERLADELEAAAPDVVVIVGDDQGELFRSVNQPAIAIFHGAEIATHPGKYGAASAPDWMKQVGRGYLMDDSYRVAGCAPFALELIEGLMDKGVDIAAVSGVEDPHKAGFGHAYGFVIKRLFRNRTIPVVPILLNTYFPPNVPTSARCYDVGQHVRSVIEAIPGDTRVAIVGSGGLSHFVVDEALDRSVIGAFISGDADVLRSIPRRALKSGSSEILNWILTAGAMEGLPLHWHEYQPLYRTPAGTGTGAAFCVWRE
jgi:hypothetical protein